MCAYIGEQEREKETERETKRRKEQIDKTKETRTSKKTKIVNGKQFRVQVHLYVMIHFLFHLWKPKLLLLKNLWRKGYKTRHKKWTQRPYTNLFMIIFRWLKYVGFKNIPLLLLFYLVSFDLSMFSYFGMYYF